MKKHFLSFIVCIVLFASCDTNEPTNKKNIGIGKFSVSESKQVTFSPGNLQYTQSTNKWSFAENQWDYIGTNNVIGGSVSSDVSGAYEGGTALADKVDLFGWSTSANNFGVSTSTDYDDYSGAFVDWGTNKIGNDAPNTWRTLSHAEWTFLFHRRANADSLFALGSVNNVNGIIILPDNWITPNDLTFVTSVTKGLYWDETFDFYRDWEDVDYFSNNTYTHSQWQEIEALGGVFLPVAGSRYGTDVRRVGSYGEYWSSIGDEGSWAHDIRFSSNVLFLSSSLNRIFGHAVRLVKDL